MLGQSSKKVSQTKTPHRSQSREYSLGSREIQTQTNRNRTRRAPKAAPALWGTKKNSQFSGTKQENPGFLARGLAQTSCEQIQYLTGPTKASQTFWDKRPLTANPYPFRTYLIWAVLLVFSLVGLILYLGRQAELGQEQRLLAEAVQAEAVFLSALAETGEPDPLTLSAQSLDVLLSALGEVRNRTGGVRFRLGHLTRLGPVLLEAGNLQPQPLSPKSPFFLATLKGTSGHSGNYLFNGSPSLLVFYEPLGPANLTLIAYKPLAAWWRESWEPLGYGFLLGLVWILLGGWLLHSSLSPWLQAHWALVGQKDRLELEVQELRDKLSLTEERFRSGWWTWDLLAPKLEFSPALVKLLALPQGQPLGSWDDFLGLVFAPDRSLLVQALEESLQKGDDLEAKFRVQLEGPLRWFRLWGQIKRNEQGKAASMRALLVEESGPQAQQAQNKLLTQVLDQTQSAVLLADSRLNIIWFNQAFTKATGLPPESLLGADLRLYLPQAAVLEEQFQQGDCWQGDFGVPDSSSFFPTPLKLDRWFNPLDQEHYHLGFLQDLGSLFNGEKQEPKEVFLDPLTGLPNRFTLFESLNQALAYASRNGHQLALLKLNLDRFKPFNQTFGTKAGDAALQEVARVLEAHRRRSDLIIRLSGDEFFLGLKDVKSPEDVFLVAQKLQEAIRAPFSFAGQELRLTARIGICLYPKDGTQPNQLLEHLDSALTYAKLQGTGTALFFSASMNLLAEERSRLTEQLQLAIAEEQFKLVYQPVVDLSSGQIVAVEGLLRWMHPSRGLLPPAEFLEVVEAAGLSLPLLEQVLSLVIKQAKRWQNAGLPKLLVTMNLTERQWHHPQLFSLLEAKLNQMNLEPQYLGLEIPATRWLSLDAESKKALLAIQERGMQIGLDDLGAGALVLPALHQSPVQGLKISQGFVGRLPLEPTLVRAMVGLGRVLGFLVGAKGVESLEQAQSLQQLGCDLAQGYFFSPPLWPKQLEPLLAQGVLLPQGFVTTADPPKGRKAEV